MRVIAGSAKGVRLRSARGLSLRPTADRVRQTIFDILGPCEGARVLDLFAGTGAMGIEALSRGALAAVLVESDRRACALIEANLEVTKLRDRGRVVRADAVQFVAKAAPGRFDLAFLDPPYGRGLAFVTRLLARLSEGDWLRPGGTVVVEAEAGPIDIPSGFRETRVRRFGRTQVTTVVKEG